MPLGQRLEDRQNGGVNGRTVAPVQPDQRCAREAVAPTRPACRTGAPVAVTGLDNPLDPAAALDQPVVAAQLDDDAQIVIVAFSVGGAGRKCRSL